MRGLWAVTVVVVLNGCAAGFATIERGDWRRVYLDVSREGEDQPQDVITLEKFEDERFEGVHRGVTNAVETPLLDVQAITLKVGEVKQFVLDEQKAELDLQVQGTASDWFWNRVVRHEEWVNGEDVVQRTSTLFAVGRKVGKSTLRVIVGDENGLTYDISVTVQ